MVNRCPPCLEQADCIPCTVVLSAEPAPPVTALGTCRRIRIHSYRDRTFQICGSNIHRPCPKLSMCRGIRWSAKISGEKVLQKSMVCCSLHIVPAPQCIYAAAGNSNVAKKRLDNGSCTNVLGTNSMLCPAHGIEHGAGL